MPNETTPLLPSTNSSARNERVLKVGKVILSNAIGFPAGLATAYLFFSPGREYANTSEIGQALTKFMHTNSWPLFEGAMINIGLTNWYFAGAAIPEYITYLQEQSTWISRLLKGGAILIYSLVDSVQSYAVAKGTNGSILSIVLNTVGGYPGNIYSSVKLFQFKIPILLEIANNYARTLSLNMKWCVFGLTDSDLELKEMLASDRANRTEFLRRLDIAYLRLLNHSRINTVSLPDNFDELINYMLEQVGEDEDIQEFTVTALARVSAGSFMGIYGFALLAAIFLNMLNVFTLFLPFPVALLASIFFCIGTTYNLLSFFYDAGAGVFDAIKNVIERKPIDWNAFQLYPKSMIAAVIVCASISILSFPLALDMFMNNYHGPFKNTIGNSVVAPASDLVHTIGGVRFAELQVQNIALTMGGIREQNIAKAHAARTKASAMTTKELKRHGFFRNRSLKVHLNNESKVYNQELQFC